MKSHTIYVGFVDSLVGYWDQDRQKADKKHAKRNDQIGWESLGSEEYTVEFTAGSPFEGAPVVLSSVGGLIAPRKVDKGAESQTYPYKVTQRFSRLAADPEIIIDPPGDQG